MKRFVAEADRGQWTLLPECLDDFIDKGYPVCVVHAFVAALDLAELGSKRSKWMLCRKQRTRNAKVVALGR